MKTTIERSLFAFLVLCALSGLAYSFGVCMHVVAKLHIDLGEFQKSTLVNVYAGGWISKKYLFSDACTLITTLENGEFDMLVYCGENVTSTSRLSMAAALEGGEIFAHYGIAGIYRKYNLNDKPIIKSSDKGYRCYKNTFEALEIPLYNPARDEALKRSNSVEQYLEANVERIQNLTSPHLDMIPTDAE